MNEKPFWTPPVPEPAPEEKPADEPFLRRWSRLKADESARLRESPEPAAPEPVTEQAPPPAEAADAAAEAPEEEALPPLDVLDENSDYSAFMSPEVSGALRKQALRKLFRSQKFNYICPMDEYNEDFTKFLPLGDIVTADMKHAAEQLLKKQLEAGEGEGEGEGESAAVVAEQSREPAAEAGAEPAEEPDTSEDKQRDA